MSDITRGRALYEQRVEFPLPNRPGVKDYVIYFVPEKDTYGGAARKFFTRFYPRHVKHPPDDSDGHDAQALLSFEDMITYLHGQVRGGVHVIRELVLVVHATPQGLIVPLMANAPAGHPLRYKDVSECSLAWLQKELQNPAFSAFRQKRSAVVACLGDESWVTIRGCRFGSSQPGVYALYSFFGGRANVYAPKKYMEFGEQAIGRGLRFEDKLAAHRHLVREHLLRHDRHIPERRDAIVDAVADQAKFSAEFELARTRRTSVDPATAPQFESLIATLDLLGSKYRTLAGSGESLRSLFPDEHRPSHNARVKLVVEGSTWVIQDVIKHAGDPYVVQYDVAKGYTSDAITLVASATVLSAVSARASVPVQLFLSDHEYDQFHGMLFTLAGYAEGGSNAAEQQRLQELLAILDAVNVDQLRPAFQDQGQVTLGPDATMRGPFDESSEEKLWYVDDQQQHYVVRLEHPVTSHGETAHTLKVYQNFNARQRHEHEFEVMQSLGEFPDTPGPELAAYLDRHAIDELTDLIDYLRSPYRPEYSIYLHQAQEAIARKSNYFAWERAQYGHEPVREQPYVELGRIEKDDKDKIAYSFNFNDVWQEVKASHPALPQFNVDLFEEGDIWRELGRQPATLADCDSRRLARPASPAVVRQGLLAHESSGRERYFAADKGTFEPSVPKIDCADLQAALTKWKQLRAAGATPDEIKQALGLAPASQSGKTLGDVIAQVYDKVVDVKNMALDDLYDGFSGAFEFDSWKIAVVKRIPFLEATSGIGRAGYLIIGLEVWGIIGGPLIAWLDYVDAAATGEAEWQKLGTLTAIRRWLRFARTLTFFTPFPDRLNIDIGRDALKAHAEEYDAERGIPAGFVYSRGSLQLGFDEGVRLMQKTGNQIISEAWQAVDAAVNSMGLKDCEVRALVDAGLLNYSAMRADVVRAIIDDLLKRLPMVTT